MGRVRSDQGRTLLNDVTKTKPCGMHDGVAFARQGKRIRRRPMGPSVFKGPRRGQNARLFRRRMPRHHGKRKERWGKRGSVDRVLSVALTESTPTFSFTNNIKGVEVRWAIQEFITSTGLTRSSDVLWCKKKEGTHYNVKMKGPPEYNPRKEINPTVWRRGV